MILSIILVVWYLLGLAGFLYHWTSKNDLTADLSLITVALLSGILGIFMWILGYVVYGKTTPRVLIKRGWK